MGTASGPRLLRARLVYAVAAAVTVAAVGAWGLGMARGGNTAAAPEPSDQGASSPALDFATPDTLRATRSPTDLPRPSHAPTPTSTAPSQPAASAAPSTSAAPVASPSAPGGTSSPTPTRGPDESPSDDPEDPMASAIADLLDPDREPRD